MSDETQTPPGGDEGGLNLDDLGMDTTPPTGDGESLLDQKQEDENILHSTTDLEAVYEIPVQVSAVLGRSTMQVNQILKLGRGAVVQLDRKVGEPIDIYVNNRLVARGEVVIQDERLGVTMTEIIKSNNS